MRLEFFVGLLLLLTVLGVLVFIFKEFFSTTRLDFSKVSLSDALARQRDTEPVPINAHLIGMTGEVVRQTGDGERPLTIRLGSERWPARPAGSDVQTADGDLPAVGSRVVVTAVAGPVVLIEPDGE
jgi:membrane protein implicated in regulation of membrane protease activity